MAGLPVIDYREAFVIQVQIVAHGNDCTKCQVAALNNIPDDFCHAFKYMKEYVDRAYEALPSYYKNRYAKAAEIINTTVRTN